MSVLLVVGEEHRMYVSFFENNYFSHSNMVVAFFDIEIGLAKRLHYSISLTTYNSFQMDQFQNF